LNDAAGGLAPGAFGVGERLTLNAFGCVVALEIPREAVEAVQQRLPSDYRITEDQPERMWRITPTDLGTWEIAAEEQRLGSRANLLDALTVGLSDLELWVAEHARGFVFIHAGTVVHDGRALILPGHSMYGKTTLTLALVAAGASYYSDEYAVFDAAGRIHPYRRRPSVRGPVPPEIDLDTVTEAGWPDQSACLGVVALVRFDGDQGWDVRPTSVAAGILGVMGHAVAARARPLEVLNSLEVASREAAYLTGTRGDSVEAARRLLGLFSREP
jgi:hypothetical protein